MTETSEKSLAELTAKYKNLYMVAQGCIEPAFRNNGDAVRACRDQACAQLFDKHYRQLSAKELDTVILYLINAQRKLATNSQLRMLKYYAFSLALVCLDSDKTMVLDGGGTATFNELREGFRRDFENKIQVPKTIMRMLYDEWINPTSNKYLIEGGYKQYCKNPSYLRFEYLTNEECQYLIVRFQKFYENTHNKTQPTIREDLN